MTRTSFIRRRAGAAKAIASRALAILATFLLSVLVAQLLGPSGAGTFFLVYTVVALLATAGRFGTDNLALRLLGGDSDAPRGDAKRLGQLSFVSATTLTAAGIPALIAVVQNQDGGAGVLAVAMAGSAILPQSMSVVAGAFLRSLGKVPVGVFAELGSVPAVACGALLLMQSMNPGSVDLDVALVTFGAAAWATAMWSVPMALREASRLGDPSSRGALPFTRFVREHLRKLVGMMGTSLLAYAMVWSPVFILAAVGTSADVAYYSVAMRIANVILLVPSIQISYLAPEFARRFYGDDLIGLNDLARRSVLQVAALTTLPVAAIVIFAPQLVTTAFGLDFSESASIVRLLCVGVFLAILCGQVNQLMLLCGLENVAFALTATMMLLWISAGWPLGVHTGVLGVAALGSVVTFTYAAIAAIWLRQARGIKSYVRIPEPSVKRQPEGPETT